MSERTDKLKATGSSTSRIEKPGLRAPMAGYMGHVPGMIALNMHGGVWRDLASKPGLQIDTKDQLASGNFDGTTPRSRFGSESSKENNFMPRMDKQWAPPVVGYGGHVPGYASGNLHGSPWKDLLTPTRKDTGVSTRRISSPLRQTGAEGAGSRPASAKLDNAAMSPRLPNNIKGYLEKHRSVCSPGSGTPRSTPRCYRDN